MTSVSSDISSFLSPQQPYTARASVTDGGAVDTTTSKVTGDRNSGLFAAASKEMGKDDFLMLLVTQLRYQDPLNPMDNTEFVSQLAQFRALESNTNIEKAIQNLDQSFKGTVDAQTYSAQSITNSGAVSLIGKSVRMRQTTLEWYAKAGESVPLQVHLGNATAGIVEIVDKDGEVVKTLEASEKDKQNSVHLVWDGTNDTGQVAKPGTYGIRIQGQESNAALYAYVQDVVEGVRFSETGALVKIGGKEISIGNVLDVSMGNGSSAATSFSPSTAVSLLGKEIRVRRESLTYNQLDNEIVTATINAGSRQQVRVNLTDSSGNVVFSTTVQADSNGIAQLVWNGETVMGQYAPAGIYQIRIEGQKDDPSLYAFLDGVVDGVTNLGGNAQIRVNGTVIDISDIVDIAERSAG